MELIYNATRRFSKNVTLEIEYQPINEYPVREALPVAAGVTAELDVLSGNGTLVLEDISDAALGVTVAHVCKPNNEFTEYGNNFRLNLDEKLQKTGTTSTGSQYVYTDQMGDKHTFDEHFYKIGESGQRIGVNVNVSAIQADDNGRLWYGGVEIFRVLTTAHGLRAAARLEGVNNAEWVEQRIDEEKQLEEQVKSYENTLTNFVLVHRSDGHITDRLTSFELSSPDAYETFVQNRTPCCSYLLTKEEAASYRSLLTQRKVINASKEAFKLQKESLYNSAKGLYLQYHSANVFPVQNISNKLQEYSLGIENESLSAQLAEHPDLNDVWHSIYEAQLEILGAPDDILSVDTKYNLWKEQNELTEKQFEDWESQLKLIEDQISKFPLGNGADTNYKSTKGTLTKQYENAQEQYTAASQQLTDVSNQINILIEKSSKYVDQLNTLYKEYRTLKNSYETLKMQVPVSYLLSDNAVKGFNYKGQLVVVQDKHGSYVAIERETYSKSGATRIASVYDQDGRTMRFVYNGRQKLAEIVNSAGLRTAFTYDASGRLTEIAREHLPNLTLSYYTSGRVSGVTAADATSASLTYSSTTGLLTGVTCKSNATVSHGEVTSSSAKVLSTVSIAYTGTETTLTYDGVRQTIYKINQNAEQVTASYTLVGGKVSGAERYTYQGHLLTKTEYADPSCLNLHTYAAFASKFAVGSAETVTYNSFEEPVFTETAMYAMPRSSGDCPTESTQTSCTYNNERKLVSRRTTHQRFDCCVAIDATTVAETFRYNATGDLVRSERYVQGEESLSGVQIEEHFYNDQGY